MQKFVILSEEAQSEPWGLGVIFRCQNSYTSSLNQGGTVCMKTVVCHEEAISLL